MAYTPEEKAKMDKLLEVFSDYIAENKDIDIAYAKKTGYVRLIVAEATDWGFFPITDFDDMLEMFLADLTADEEDRLFEVSGDYSLVDFQRPRAYLTERLNMLDEDREYALQKMEQYLERWKLRLAQA